MNYMPVWLTSSIIKHIQVYFRPANECHRQIKGEKPGDESLEVRKQNQYCVLNVNYKAYRVHVICADTLKKRTAISVSNSKKTRI